MKYILILTILAIVSCTKPKVEVVDRKKLLQECYLDSIPNK